KRVLLLTTPSSYRTEAFVRAAERLGLELCQAIDLPAPLAREWNVPLGVDFTRPDEAVEQVVRYLEEHPVEAVVPVDDSATVLAALIAARLRLPHNAPDAALAARDKLVMRRMLARGGVPVPTFASFSAAEDPDAIARQVAYPCVVKPTILSGSRGVIRADSPAELAAAFERTRAILTSEGHAPEAATILIEEFIPGVEVAVEGLLTDGELQVLAIFDKPDPLDGPYFEETIYVTPSRLSEETQAAIARRTAEGAAALGLRHGPIHAELRVNDRGPWIIEMAGRSIGGLCSTILEFGTGRTLEELILSHAVGEPIDAIERVGAAVGVMMIPIPGAGILR
ncbi:MAG: ATP-grasp domain-containing protein, partial [Thermomicrobiaceae bacterium]|nr:ATP-grasp domain-containing protein [Thermomicrobiaceae bacterium]